MFYVKIADHVFRIENRYSMIERMCSDYLTASQPDAYCIAVSDAELERESSDGSCSNEYLETLAVYRKLCEHIIPDSYMLFHGSALSIDSKAVIFTAPSGTGKSTHSSLWERYMPEYVVMINDDKPIIHVTESGCTVYGTPWCGKHGRQHNMTAQLKALVYIQRSKENSIVRMEVKDIYHRIFAQMYRPAKVMELKKSMEMLRIMLDSVPVYVLNCDISKEAVDTVYEELKKEGIL